MKPFLLFLLIFPPHVSANSNSMLKIKNPMLAPMISEFEEICQNTGVSPVGKSFTQMCQVVSKSSTCKSVEAKDRINCNNIASEGIVDSWAFIGQCAEGAFKSVKETLSFISEMIQISAKSTLSTSELKKNSKAVQELMNSSKLYLHTEYQKALARARPPMREVKALHSLSAGIGQLIISHVSNFINSQNDRFACLNQRARNQYMCEVLGNILIPPTGLVAIIKVGPKVAMQSFPHLKTATKKKDEKDDQPKNFNEALVKYPKLKNVYDKIGLQVTTSPKINHPREIPFMYGDNLRGKVRGKDMILRADELPKEIAASITGAYNALNDREQIKSYYQKLYKEVIERMLKKGKESDLKLLSRGEISQQALNVVIVQRHKARGDNHFSNFMVQGFDDVLKFPKGRIDPATLKSQGDVFRAAIKNGPFIDRVFDDSNPNNHGSFTHMMQRDMAHSAIHKATNGKPKVFWDFLGSPKGVNWWVDIFDSANPSSFTKPEVLRKSIDDNLKSR